MLGAGWPDDWGKMAQFWGKIAKTVAEAQKYAKTSTPKLNLKVQKRLHQTTFEYSTYLQQFLISKQLIRAKM
jgi:hypothetical protein